MPKPNILFILADDMGAWSMRCAGLGDIDTPNLDRIAAEGARFEHFFCASPVCSPARASLLTGRIPSAHGVHDWIRSGNLDAARFAAQGETNPYGGYRDERTPIAYLAGIPTYTDMLANAGYACALAGKWHLGDSVRPQCGFSRWYTIGKGGCHYLHPDIVEDGDIRVRDGEYVTDLITARACEDIRALAHRETPFYLSVHYTAPHDPWAADQHPARWIERYEDSAFAGFPDVPDHPDMTTGPVYGTPRRRENLRGYCAAVSAMDEGIGRILAALGREGILDDTLVIFTADNGMSMGHHGIWGKGNGTFPANMYDTAVKVPFLLRYPALTPTPGMVSHALVSAVDLFPTLADLIGAELPEGLPGRSFLPALRGGDARDAVVIADEYGPVRMLRTREWKYVHRHPYGPHELYDLLNDPEELVNVADAPGNAARALDMRRRLYAYFDRYALPALDGAREAVCGTGQYCRVGAAATRLNAFAPPPVTAKERGTR